MIRALAEMTVRLTLGLVMGLADLMPGYNDEQRLTNLILACYGVALVVLAGDLLLTAILSLLVFVP